MPKKYPQLEMDRPVRVGDHVRIILPNNSHDYFISSIKGSQIYITLGPGEEGLLVQDRDGRYQLQDLKIIHRIEFIAVEQQVLTGIVPLDIQILLHLDDTSLKTLCQLDPYLNKVCLEDELWNEKLRDRFPSNIVKLKTREMNPGDFYLLLVDYPLSSVGANLALLRLDEWSLGLLSKLGFSPNIDLTGQAPEDTLVQMNDHLIVFFQKAQFGPQVSGDIVLNPVTQVKEIQSVKTFEGTRLNDLFYFVQPFINGRVNPLYGVIHVRVLISLLALHVYYTNMNYPDNPLRLTASQDMRTYLHHIMRDEISRGEDFFRQSYRVAQLTRAIDDPDLHIPNTSQNFNPNDFDWIKFDMLIYRALLRTTIKLDEVRFDTSLVYSSIPGITPENSIEKVELLYHHIIIMAQQVVDPNLIRMGLDL